MTTAINQDTSASHHVNINASMTQLQMAMFMKNISMLGGAFLILHFGSGPLSIK